MARWLQSGLRRDACAVVAALDDPSAQQVKRELERHYEGTVKPRTFYGALETLAEKGYLETRTEGIHDHYSLTDGGERALREHYAWLGDCLD
ncbi:MAG: helix-turn-helix transcriptional regulator [Haloarculaceae archaeon]